MNGKPWIEISHMLPSEARHGDRQAVRNWLAVWSRTQRSEAVVVIDLRTGQMRAGTNHSADGIELPDDLNAKTKEPGQQLEVWHNHPRTADAQTNSIPGPDDIIAAMRPGVAGIGIVDNYADWQLIKAGAQRIDNEEAAKRWLQEAAIIVEIAISSGSGRETSRQRIAIKTAEMVVAAAHAAGLIDAKGIDQQSEKLGQGIADATKGSVGTPAELAAKMGNGGSGNSKLGHSGGDAQTEGAQTWPTQQSRHGGW